MLPHVVAARHVRDHVLWLRFDDGVEGEIDLAHELQGPIFEPLRNPDYFARFQIHPELRTLVWSNRADFAPVVSASVTAIVPRSKAHVPEPAYRRLCRMEEWEVVLALVCVVPQAGQAGIAHASKAVADSV